MRLGLKIKIDAFADKSNPGFVNCSFNDALGREHKLFDKIPVVTDEDLDENSEYPREGIIGCEIIEQNPDKNNPEIVKVNIVEPLQISTLNDETIFLVFKNQLADLNLWTGRK